MPGWNKDNRLRHNREYRVVYRVGKSVANKDIVLYFARNRQSNVRAGFSVSKKIGKSVVRNRVRRLIKEVFRLHINDIKPGYDLIFIARTGNKSLKYDDMERAVLDVLKRAGLYIDKKNRVDEI
ncbi:ribonuclease P protein component [Mahella sp.]|uniref:ribonuclease P protein component n=1 Tax=Mahella sp. TaxID=2798721 RepID=UPI0025C31907|nr:ribonuclease P protein component [Mahella sp.]MBZ4665214.1 ribonuclease protein component [Mahella sp.]